MRLLSGPNAPNVVIVAMFVSKYIWDWRQRKGYPLSALRGELRPVDSEEIDLYLKEIEEEDREEAYLSREARRERADACLGYVVVMKRNAWCFHMGATFDRYKIKSNKLSFQLNEEEALVWALKRESEMLLWRLRRSEIILRYKRLMGLRVNSRVLHTIKMDYKTFEEQMVHFADMFKHGSGLRVALALEPGWGVVRGGTAHLGRHDQEYDVDVDDDEGEEFDVDMDDDSGPDAG
jgi:hypothetical protein